MQDVEKLFGVFQHTLVDKSVPLLRGFDEVYWKMCIRDRARATNAWLVPSQSVPLLKYFDGYGISTVCASATPFGLTLAPD